MESSHNKGKNTFRTRNTRQVGNQKEQLAKGYLEQQGYHILEQNFYAKAGEIDLIAKEGEYLVFIEVKYRSNERNGHPLEAVTLSKQKKIMHTARYYMLKHGILEDSPCRFDVVAILDNEITVIKDAF